MPKTTTTAVVKNQTTELNFLAKRIREVHPQAKMFFSNLTFARFAIGCWLMRARSILPDSKRGPGAEDADDLTFVKWKHREFPDMNNSTLANYQTFAETALARHPALEGFDPNKTVSDAEREDVLAQLKQCVNGKDQTLFLRTMNEIPDATPAGGDRGGRRPKKDLIRDAEAERKRAEDAWMEIVERIEGEMALESYKTLSHVVLDRIIHALGAGKKISQFLDK